mgnify:CR=1 FL=1
MSHDDIKKKIFVKHIIAVQGETILHMIITWDQSSWLFPMAQGSISSQNNYCRNTRRDHEDKLCVFLNKFLVYFYNHEHMHDEHLL